MTLNRSFALGAVTSFFGLLLLSEVLLRLTVPTGFWYSHFDFSGDLTSLAELKDRVRYSVPPENRILLLGDSVLGASAIMEHRIPRGRTLTLNRYLSQGLESQGWHSLSLGSDGMLLPDIEALTPEIGAIPPRKILLLLNFRMFSQEFNQGSKALSRSFLLAELPVEIQKSLAPDKPLSQEAQLGDELYAGMSDHWVLFREAQMAKTLWYYPSQKDFFQQLLERMVGKNESASDLMEAALKQKIASYYQPYLWDKNALPFTCLKQVLDQWAVQDHIPITIVLTPQNQKFLGEYLDLPSFQKNRKALAAFLKPYLSSGVVYEDWADRYPSSSFLDHCHLTPKGNDQYSKDLVGLLSGGKQ
jgi:hypothetical protein